MKLYCMLCTVESSHKYEKVREGYYQTLPGGNPQSLMENGSGEGE